MSAGERRLRWGVLGTGSIADEMVAAMRGARRCVAQAVASRDRAKSEAFAAHHGVATAHTGYEALLADPEVDVVYIALPHQEHARWAIAAVQAGKHVLCEKPLTVGAPAAERVVAVARQAGVMLVEAFAYRFHPQTRVLLDLIRDQAIGEVRTIRVSFGYEMPDAATTRIILNALAGGGILDVGCYCTAISRDIVAAATGIAAPEPDEVAAVACLHPVERTDELSAAVMRFGGVVATLACGVTLSQDNELVVAGTQGTIRVEHPCWLDGRRDASSIVEVRPLDGEKQEIAIPGGQHVFALEADGVAALLDAGPAGWEEACADTLANMRTLDRWRAAVGVHYPFEADA